LTFGSFPTEITSETLTATPTQLRIVDSGKLHDAELVGTDTLSIKTGCKQCGLQYKIQVIDDSVLKIYNQ